jgi:hypothetical protein
MAKVVKGIQRDIKLIDDERARIKEELTVKIKAARSLTDNAIRHLLNNR